MFDERKASAYKSKRERSFAFKIRHSAFGEITMLPQTHSWLWRGTAPHILPHIQRLDFVGGILLKYFVPGWARHTYQLQTVCTQIAVLHPSVLMT